MCSFYWKLSLSGVSLESPGLEIIPHVSGNRAKVAQHHDARRLVSATLLVLKWSGAIFRSRSSTPSVRSFYLCPFHWKLRTLGVSLESSGLENIPQVPVNQPKVAQNHDARSAVSATLSVLKWTGAIFWPRSFTPSVRSFYLCPFHWKLRQSRVSFESQKLENIHQVPANRAKVADNHKARKAVSATLSVLKWSGAIFWPRSSTPSVRSFYVCLFHWKRRPSRVSLESPELENIPQVLPNRAKLAQNHNKRKAVLATLLLLKWSGSIFRTRSSTLGECSFYLFPFHRKLRSSGVTLESPRLQKISPKFPEIQPKLLKITMRVRRSRLLFQS